MDNRKASKTRSFSGRSLGRDCTNLDARFNGFFFQWRGPGRFLDGHFLGLNLAGVLPARWLTMRTPRMQDAEDSISIPTAAAACLVVMLGMFLDA
jgi:hypothetical protein